MAYHVETSPLICRVNQWTGSYMIGTSMKELNCGLTLSWRSLWEIVVMFFIRDEKFEMIASHGCLVRILGTFFS